MGIDAGLEMSISTRNLCQHQKEVEGSCGLFLKVVWINLCLDRKEFEGSFGLI